MSDTSTRETSREKALVRAGIAAVASRGSTTVATLLLTPLLAHLLGIQGYGVLVTLTTTSFLLLLGDLGIASGLVSKLGVNNKGPEHARTIISSAYAVVGAASAVGIAAAALLAVALPWDSWTGADGVSSGAIHTAAFIALAGTALQMTTNLGQKIELSRQRGHAASLWLAIANIGAPVMATALAALTHDLRWTVAGMCLTPPLVMYVQSVRVIRSLPPEMRPHRDHVSRAMVRELLGSGAQFTGIALLGAVAFQLDTLIVSSFLGSEAAAKYSVTIKLFALVSTTIHVAVTQLWSAFADATRHGDVQWARRTLVRSSIYCTGAAAVLSAGLFVIGVPLIRLWLGEAFVPTTGLLAAAAVWTVVSSGGSPLAFFLNGNEKQRQQLIAGLPMAVCNVGLSLWLVQVVGTSGVLWASSIAWISFVSVPLGITARNLLRRQEAAQVAAQETTSATAVQTEDDAVTHLTDPARQLDGAPRTDPPTDQQVASPTDGVGPVPPAGTGGPGYRPDIDGLRAIAVLAVVGFHFFPGFFPGGFVGVDVFFVVSGYLITGLMVRRVELGTFTMRDFYARRVRRIFPALAIVLVATLVVGWVVLFSDEFRDLGAEAAAGSFFVANFHFMQEASYFDADAYTKPLLHLWSLAIEEQFYLVWPVIVVLALRRGRRFTLWVVGAITVASLLFNLYLVAADPAQAYYSPFSRFWQLSAGGMLALTVLGDGMRRRWAATVVSLVGLLMIAFSVLTFSAALAYPGVWGVVPVVGTLAVMMAGRASLINNGPLSWRLAVSIGLISYPLYLWHWPMISLATIVGRGFPSGPVRLGLLLVAFVLAIGTYRLVERPLRRRRSAERVVRPLAVGVLVVGLFSVLVATPVGPSSAHSQSSGSLSSLRAWPYEMNQRCNDRYPFDKKVGGWWFCTTNADRDPDVLVLGDSTANELYPGVVSAFPGSTVLSIGTCAPTQGITFRPIAPTPGNPCFQPRSIDQERFLDRTIARLSTPWVVVNMIWPRFDAEGRWVDAAGQPAGSIVERSGGAGVSDRDALVDGLARRITSIEKAGGKVVLVGPKPQIDYDIAQCFARPFNEKVRSCSVDVDAERSAVDAWKQIVSDVRAKGPSAAAFDQSPVYCGVSVCSLVSGGRPLMRDQVHLSVTGSRLVGDRLAGWTRQNVPGFGRE